MTKGLFDDADIDVPCPGCGHENRKTMRWLRDNTQMTCGGCGQPVILENQQLRRDMDDLDQSFGELRRAIEKPIKIRL